MSHKEPDTITVGDLKHMLEDYGDNDLVMVSHKAGDYWRTQLASGIESTETNQVEYSGYHNQFKIREYDPDDEDHGEDKQEVVVLNLNQAY